MGLHVSAKGRYASQLPLQPAVVWPPLYRRQVTLSRVFATAAGMVRAIVSKSSGSVSPRPGVHRTARGLGDVLGAHFSSFRPLLAQ
jgi:hypothetical protein